MGDRIAEFQEAQEEIARWAVVQKRRKQIPLASTPLPMVEEEEVVEIIRLAELLTQDQEAVLVGIAKS